jgi:hypothetical protein
VPLNRVLLAKPAPVRLECGEISLVHSGRTRRTRFDLALVRASLARAYCNAADLRSAGRARGGSQIK